MEKAKGLRGAACAETISKQENRCMWVEIVNLGECRKSQESSVSILQHFKLSWTFITISKLDFKKKKQQQDTGCSETKPSYNKVKTSFKTCARGWGDGTVAEVTAFQV